MTSKLPFHHTLDSKKRQNIMGGRFTLPSELSYEVCDLLNQMLVTDPSQRISMREISEHMWMQQSCVPRFLNHHP